MEHRGGFRGRGGFGMNSRGRGRGMMRPGGFGGGPMNGGPMMRGRGRGGPPRGPPRGMGMGNPGMNRGTGRGRFPGGFRSDSNGYFQNQNQSENSAPAPAPEAVVTEKPIIPVTPSSNNVQVVTSGPTQPSQPQQQQPSQTTPTQQSNPTLNNSRGSFTPRGRSSFQSRGGFVSRGRGGYQGQNGPPRQQFDTRQPSNLTPASTTGFNPIKRGGYAGGPPVKRGRYDQGPGGYSSNRMPPQNQISSMPPQQHHQSSYNNVPPHSGSYQDHSSQYMDQYQHTGYNNNSMPPQSSYSNNGYGQSYGSNAAPVSYAPQADYDHSAASGGYQDYNASSYPTHDSRYATTGYSQDYRQPYGSSQTDYGQVAQDSSSYSTGTFDRGSYGGNYDSYSQGYNGQSGYY